MIKTNAMRILDSKKIKYEVLEYPHDEFIPASEMAEILGLDYDLVYKTIVSISNDRVYYVCVIPAKYEIDLKKAAKCFNVKSLELLDVNKLLNITGYIRGGCSPIGMKKLFKTIVDESAIDKEFIYFSGGKRGVQIKMNPFDLKNVINCEFKSIIKE